MKLLIVYGTNSGSARLSSEIMKETLEQVGNTVTLKSAAQADPGDVQSYDLVIFGCCTWETKTKDRMLEGSLQQHFAKFRDRLKGSMFPGKKFAVFGLGDSSYTNFCIAANHLEALVKQIGGTQVGATLRVDSFFFDREENEKKVRQWARSLLTAVGA